MVKIQTLLLMEDENHGKKCQENMLNFKNQMVTKTSHNYTEKGQSRMRSKTYNGTSRWGSYLGLLVLQNGPIKHIIELKT